MDYEEEQSSELESLVSIYCDDIQVISENCPRKLRIRLQAGGDNGEEVSCELVFTQPPKYPDEPPDIDTETTENLEPEDEEQLKEHLLELAKENLGMVMIFTLAAGAQEWLDSKSDKIKKEKEEGVLKKQLAEEEAEMKRFEGTRVTVETFLLWRNQFEIETGINLKREKELKDIRKLTGKELFLRDNTLNESDLKFLDDADIVKVDESLFQDLDDLDISESSDDDYCPSGSDDENDNQTAKTKNSIVTRSKAKR